MSNLGLNFIPLFNLIFFIYQLIYIAFLKDVNSIFIFLLQSLKTFASLSYPFSICLLFPSHFSVSSVSPCVSLLSLYLSLSLCLCLPVCLSLSCSHSYKHVKFTGQCSEIESFLLHVSFGKLHVS